jgi:hypothetical protein
VELDSEYLDSEYEDYTCEPGEIGDIACAIADSFVIVGLGESMAATSELIRRCKTDACFYGAAAWGVLNLWVGCLYLDWRLDADIPGCSFDDDEALDVTAENQSHAPDNETEGSWNDEYVLAA